MKVVLHETIENALKKISKWWKGETKCPCFAFSVRKIYESIQPLENLNKYWPSNDGNPDFESLVQMMIKDIEANDYFGEAIPILPHSWGRIGTPLTMAAYLGGEVKLDEDTVWVPLL